MRLILSLLLLPILYKPVIADEHERRFPPSQKFTLKINNVQVEVPYAYLQEHWLVKLKKNKIVDAQAHRQGGIYFQYLFPSLAPPPKTCGPNKQYCTGTPIKGFAAAPKGVKQVYVSYIVRELKDKIPTDYDTAQFLRGPTAHHVLYGDKFTKNKELGLIESKPLMDFERYVPIKMPEHITMIRCLSEDCSIFQFDDQNNLIHAIGIHKDQLPQWEAILKSRRTIFERYLKK